MLDRRAAVVKIKAGQVIVADPTMRVTKDDSADRSNQLLVLAMNPAGQAFASATAAMSGKCHRNVQSCRNSGIVQAAGSRVCNRFVMPGPPIRRESDIASAALDHVAVDEHHVAGDQRIHTTLEAISRTGPLMQPINEAAIRVMIPAQEDELLGWKFFVVPIQPRQRGRDRVVVMPHSAPAKIKQVPAPNANITPLDHLPNQRLVLDRRRPAAEAMQIRNEAHSCFDTSGSRSDFDLWCVVTGHDMLAEGGLGQNAWLTRAKADLSSSE